MDLLGFVALNPTYDLPVLLGKCETQLQQETLGPTPGKGITPLAIIPL